MIRRRINTKKLFPFTDAESSDSCQTDYSEKRAIPISIPTMHVKNKDGERYVVRVYLLQTAQYRVIRFLLDIIYKINPYYIDNRRTTL